MKKFRLIALLLIIMSVVLCGCGEKTEKPKEQETTQQQTTQPQQDTSKPQEQDSTQNQQNTENPANTSQQTAKEETYQDKLLDKIPLSADLYLGWDFRDITVNGEFRRVHATFIIDPAVIDQDPCYAYYHLGMHGEKGVLAYEVLSVGRYFLNEFMLDYVRECEANGELEMMDSTIFERDLIAYPFKGKDTEYVVISVPAGWEQNSSTMVISTDQAKLLADMFVDTSNKVTLQGEDASKYMDNEGNTVFFGFNEDYITYLKVSKIENGVTYLSEYSIEIDGDKVTSVETGKTYTTNDTVPDLKGISVY